METALLLIDAQVNRFEPEPVHRADDLLSRLVGLLGRARAAGLPVIHARHSGAAGAPDELGTPGWQIHPALAPAEGEVVVDTAGPDAFYQTRLSGVLTARGIRRLVLAGTRSEYAVDTTCRRAASLGYEVVLAADGHSTYPGDLSAEQIVAHHNRVLRAFAEVVPAADVALDSAVIQPVRGEALTAADYAGIRAGLEEWPTYERWLSTGAGAPYWPYTHPTRVADALKQLWDPAFTPRGRYTDPPRWEMGLARTFFQPLENIPMAFRRLTLHPVTQAIDHLLQNPRNPLSPHISQLDEHLWVYDARDLRLYYVPTVTHDTAGVERRYVFLVWLAAGVPIRNPFA